MTLRRYRRTAMISCEARAIPRPIWAVVCRRRGLSQGYSSTTGLALQRSTSLPVITFLMSHTTLELRLTGSLKCSLRTAAKPSSFVKEWPYMSACVDCETKGNSVQKDDFELSVLLSACIVWTFRLPQISLTHLAIHYLSLYSVAAITQINP